MAEEMGERLAALRGELVGYAYRMLASPFEAEDAVQETLLRAWKHAADYDPARGALRTWVYRIATNVCLDMLRAAGRRALCTDFAASGFDEPPLPPGAWVLPFLEDPAAEAERRDSVRLAFVAALQHLPPRQRAVLLLRDVLCWHADEVAELLETTVPAVTSALQRARGAIRAPDSPAPTPVAAQRELVERYADAFHRYDIAAIVALLRADAIAAMPPFRWWIRGAEAIGQVMAAADGACDGARLLPAWANGAPALWQYRAGEPFALIVFDFDGELISGVTTFLGDPVTGLAPPTNLRGHP